MSAPDHTLQSLVSLFEGKGRLSVPELRDCPALVHCDPAAKRDEWGFETRAAVAPWGTRVALALAKTGKLGDMEMLAQAGAVFAVTKRPGGPFPDRIGLGRARTADISVRLPSVSKYHAYFTFDPQDGSWRLWDARSRNGTRVGEETVKPMEGRLLENGVDIHLGEDKFLFFTEHGFAALVQSLAQSGPKRR